MTTIVPSSIPPLPTPVSDTRHLPPDSPTCTPAQQFVAAMDGALAALRHPVRMEGGTNGHYVYRLLDFVTQREVLRCRIVVPGQLELTLPDVAPRTYAVTLQDPLVLARLVEQHARQHNSTRPMVSVTVVHDLAAAHWRVSLCIHIRKTTATGDTLVDAWRTVKQQAGVTSLATTAPAGWRYQRRDVEPLRITPERAARARQIRKTLAGQLPGDDLFTLAQRVDTKQSGPND